MSDPQDFEAYVAGERLAEQKETEKLIARIDLSALAARASHLRNGIPCHIPPLRYDHSSRTSVMGNMNYHVHLRFDDGVCWLARIRRCNAESPPSCLQDYAMKSEVATLCFLEKTKVPAPKVYDFALEGKDNPVGIGYILMEKMPEKSLRWSLASADQKEKVASQVAQSYLELSAHPFQFMGSLDTPNTLSIGDFARESLVDFTESGMHLLDRCSSAKDFYTEVIRLTLELIRRGEAYSEEHRVDAYLIHKFLLDCVPTIFSSPSDNGPFYLKHADEKGDQILVDDEYNVTGIIDWEWAYTTSKLCAFCAPIVFIPVNHFFDGDNRLSDAEVLFAQKLEEGGDLEMAFAVRNGRIRHRFEFCCGGNLSQWQDFLGLFEGLRRAMELDEDLSWEAWRETALERYGDDGELQLLISGGQTKAPSENVLIHG
ncbi:MAG: hypothetical protein M1819_003767 [Sarea resinae]|nr:MAG: hypothetical protein M1819_003767 [Sarea resinae]